MDGRSEKTHESKQHDQPRSCGGVWLERKLREKGYHGPEEVLLAMAATGDQLTVYPMETKKEAREIR